MGYGIGSVLAFIVAVFARLVGLDRDRAFYPTVLIVIASTYVLFAVMGGSMQALMIESIAMTLSLQLLSGSSSIHGLSFWGSWATAFLISSTGASSIILVYRYGGRPFAWRTTLSLAAIWRGCCRGRAPV